MRDLRLVGLSEDGTRLVLELAGERFTLPVDERLHAALRGDRARLGQLEIELESRLRPRDIQARIRAGQSVEAVAAEAGIGVDRVLRFAGPVIHEREHMAAEARAAGVRRSDQGAVTLLGELVSGRLEERGVPADALVWDSWRRDDGRWEVRLAYVAGDTERVALWIYDPVRRLVTADDSEARWLLEDEPPAQVRALRPRRPVEPEPDARSAPTPGPDDEAAGGLEDEATDQTAEPEPARGTAPDSRPARPASAKRASVPSWDEIVFGTRKPD